MSKSCLYYTTAASLPRVGASASFLTNFLYTLHWSGMAIRTFPAANPVDDGLEDESLEVSDTENFNNIPENVHELIVCDWSPE